MKSLNMIIGIASLVCLLSTGAMAREDPTGVSFFMYEDGSGDGQTVYCKSSPLNAVELGDWVCQSDDSELGTVDGPVEEGTLCELQCDHRHSIARGRYEVTCTEDGWQNHPDQSENPPVCLSHPKACGELPDKPNGMWKCGEDVESRVCSMSCDQFHDHFDGSTTACTKSGWYPQPADISCVTCKAPPPPSHGSWNCNDFGNIPEYQHNIRVCAAYCDSGFINTGNNMALCSMSGRDTFTPDPQLSVCQPACPDLPKTVKNGSWSCQQERPPFTGECFLTCDEGTGRIGDGVASCDVGPVWTEDGTCAFPFNISVSNELGGMLVSVIINGKIYYQAKTDSSGHVQLYSPQGPAVITGELEDFQMDPIAINVGVEGVQQTINMIASPACLSLPAVVQNGTWICEDKEAPYANECSLTCDNGATLIGDGITSCGLGSVWTGQDDKCLFSLDISIGNAIDKSQLNGMVVSLMVNGKIYNQSISDSSGYVQLYSPHGEAVITGELDGFQMDPLTISVGVEEVHDTINISASPACLSLPAVVKNGTWTCEDKEAPYANECSLTCDKGATLIGDGITSCGLGSVWTGQDDKCIFSLTVEIASAIDKSQLNGMLMSLMVDGEIYNQSVADRSGHVQLYSPHGEAVIKGTLDGFKMEPITVTVGVEEVQEIIKVSASPACPNLPAMVENETWICKDKEAPYANECSLKCDNGATLIGDGITTCSLGSVWTGRDDKCLFSLDISLGNAIDKSQLNGMVVSLMVDGKVYNQSISDSSGHVQLFSPHGQAVITGELDGFQMDPITVNVGVEGVQETINISASPACPSLPAVVKNGTWICEDKEAPYANNCVLRCDSGSTLLGDGIASCGLGAVWTDEDDKCIFSLTISTANAVNNSRLSGMLVFLMVDGQIYDQSQTNSSGYAKLNSPHGAVTITGEMDGWRMDPINTVVGTGMAQRIIEAFALPEGVSILTISTANAINNRQVGGMLVSLHAQNRLFSQAITNSIGEATLASPHGEVVITGEKDGFQMAPIPLTVTDEVSKSDIKISASPETSEPARVVMNWGRLPNDLDLHVRQVSGGSTVCHCYYSNKQCSGIALDIDNTSGGHNGAETITWSRMERRKQYVVYVHDYSGTNTHLTASAARLAIYRSGQRPMQVNVPTRDGASRSRYWLVGCFNSDGRNGFTVINQLRTSEPTSC